MDSIINLQKKIVPELTNLLVQRYQILRQVSHEYPIGRRALAARLGLSERVLRAQVDFLKKQNITNMVDVVQLVRASDCGSECRGFESHLPPKINPARFISCRVSCYISVLSGNSFLSYKRIAIVFLKVYYRLKTYKKAC